MKFCWLHQQGNRDCLLFFAGWGMCPEPFLDIAPGSVDVLMLYDHRSMDLQEISSFLKDLQGKGDYGRLHLLAWSMGVWAAALLFGNKIPSPPELASAIAIGGTCSPIDDRLGLPAHNFADMAERLSPARMRAFHRSMFADQEEAERFTTSFSRGERSFQGLQHELLTLATAYKAQPEAPNIYTSRIVTGRDQIFPARNQVRAWGRNKCRTLSLPHFPFYQWPSWSAMLQELT